MLYYNGQNPYTALQFYTNWVCNLTIICINANKFCLQDYSTPTHMIWVYKKNSEQFNLNKPNNSEHFNLNKPNNSEQFKRNEPVLKLYYYGQNPYTKLQFYTIWVCNLTIASMPIIYVYKITVRLLIWSEFIYIVL